MGWTGMQPPAHGDKRRWLLEEFNQAGEVGTNPSWTLSDLSIKGNTAYGIYTMVRVDGSWHSMGIVILMSFRADEWAYKDMTEEMMPYYYDAPLSLIHKLEKLCPAIEGNARQWRDYCIAQATKIKVKLETGTTVKFKHELNFRLFKADTFEVFKDGRKTFFYAPNGVKCRITKWQDKEYEVIA
jgi:hypothetical protein